MRFRATDSSSCCSVMSPLVVDDRVCFDLDTPAWVQEALHHDEPGCRTHAAEHFTVHAADRGTIGRVDEKDARPHHMVEAGVELLERLGDDLEDAARLLARIIDDLVVGPDGGRRGDGDVAADAHRTAEADARLEWGT